MPSLVPFSIVFCQYTTLIYQRNKSSNFLIIHISGCVFIDSCTFYFVITKSSSSSVNYPSLISHRLVIIYVRGLFVT